jgi:AraC-like DNA-binding protein
MYDFMMSSLEPPTSEDADTVPVALPSGEFRLGTRAGPARGLVGRGPLRLRFADAALLVSLLPRLVHVQGEKRLATLMTLVSEESRAQRPARDVILARLLEVLLIEALRSTTGTEASPGLLRGLADGRLAVAVRRMHEEPTRPWTVAQLAKEAALSRSAFFERFKRAVGVAPMAYLLAWRMALAKNLLRRKEGNVAEVAERVATAPRARSASRSPLCSGLPPMQYAREKAEQ